MSTRVQHDTPECYITDLNTVLEKTIGRSTSQEIPRFLWNWEVRDRVHNSPSLVPILSQINPIHTLQPNFPNMHFDVILTSTPRSSVYFLSAFSTKVL